jgi:murein tripeptide amidase MpaA
VERKVIANTHAQHMCETLMFTDKNSSESDKPYILILARQHPGETVGSYMMHGVMEFLLQDSPECRFLKENFVMVLVPMMNPDGVVHGNYRYWHS